MTKAIKLEGRRLQRGSRSDDRNAEYSNDGSLSSLSPSLTGFGDDGSTFEDVHLFSRELDEVTKLGGSQCGLITSLRTGYKGWNTASGIMFTIQPSKEAIELLTLEFPTFENYGASSSNPSAARKVQVYYRMGSFSGVMNNPAAWTLLADTSARLVSPLPQPATSNPAGLDMGAIVPASEFKSVSLQAGEEYSIYISGEVSSPNPRETLLKVKPADALVGDLTTENDSLQISTGVRLKGSSPFPSTFDEPADFNGILHYRATKSCNDSTMFTTTDIVLEFAVNKDPDSNVVASLRSAVQETLDEWLSTNESLIQYSKEAMLKWDGIRTDFKGRSEEKCPIDFAECALIAATVSFKHWHNLDKGLLEMEILRQKKELDGMVYSYMSPIETEYVSIPLSKVEFAITLSGVPNGAYMNNVQKRYFEKVTVDFLRKSMTSKVFNAIVSDEVPETLFVEDGEQQRIRSRNLLSIFGIATSETTEREPMLRSRRKLEGTAGGGKIQIITEVAAEGTVQELRNAVIEEIALNPDDYTMELSSHQMRPVGTNEDDYGDFFTHLTNVQVKLHVSTSTGGDVGSSGSGSGNDISNPIETQGTLWTVVCILLIVFSFFWLFYRVYMDCFHSPYQKQIKLRNGQDEFKDEDESENVVDDSMLGRLKYNLGLTNPNVTLNTSDASTKNKSAIPRQRSFNDRRPSSNHSRSDTAPSRMTRSRSREKPRNSEAYCYDDDALSCSSGDVESDDESLKKSTPRRSPSGPSRGRLAPSKSMPVHLKNERKALSKSLHAEKRAKAIPNKALSKSLHHDKPPKPIPRRSPSGPKRGKLAATKSMPVQRRNSSSDKKAQRNDVSKFLSKSSHHGDKPPKPIPRRSPNSEPRRGKLAATKSMPLQKRSQGSPGTNTKKQNKALSKSHHVAKQEKSTPKRSPSMPERGRLAPSKSLPAEKSDAKRTGSMPAKEKKESPKKAAHLESPSSSSRDGESILAKKRKAQEKNEKNTKGSKPKNSKKKKKKLEKQSSPSQAKKKKTKEKKREIKASKSMPVQKTTQKSASEATSFMKLSDMVHASSSESEGGSSSEFASYSVTSDTLDSSLTKSSWSTGGQKPESKKSYGKAGKIMFGRVNRSLSGVAEA